MFNQNTHLVEAKCSFLQVCVCVCVCVCQKHGLASTEYVIFIFQKIRFVEARLSEVALFGNVRFAEAKRSKTKRNIILSSVWGGGAGISFLAAHPLQ